MTVGFLIDMGTELRALLFIYKLLFNLHPLIFLVSLHSGTCSMTFHEGRRDPLYPIDLGWNCYLAAWEKILYSRSLTVPLKDVSTSSLTFSPMLYSYLPGSLVPSIPEPFWESACKSTCFSSVSTLPAHFTFFCFTNSVDISETAFHLSKLCSYLVQLQFHFLFCCYRCSHIKKIFSAISAGFPDGTAIDVCPICHVQPEVSTIQLNKYLYGLYLV